MQYETRHLEARRELSHGDAFHRPGDRFQASVIDAGYLVRNGSATEVQPPQKAPPQEAPPATPRPARGRRVGAVEATVDSGNAGVDTNADAGDSSDTGS